MTVNLIDKIELTSTGELSVFPHDYSDEFEFIYRAAKGIFWNKEIKMFTTPLSKERSYSECFKMLHEAVLSEFGIDLKITHQTQWQNVTHELKVQIVDLGSSQ